MIAVNLSWNLEKIHAGKLKRKNRVFRKPISSECKNYNRR